MAKDMKTFPAMKNGKFIGYATAEQIANHDSLELFDEDKAKRIEAEKDVKAAEKKQAAADVKKDDAVKAGGADSSAVKKGPAK